MNTVVMLKPAAKCNKDRRHINVFSVLLGFGKGALSNPSSFYDVIRWPVAQPPMPQQNVADKGGCIFSCGGAPFWVFTWSRYAPLQKPIKPQHTRIRSGHTVKSTSQ